MILLATEEGEASRHQREVTAGSDLTSGSTLGYGGSSWKFKGDFKEPEMGNACEGANLEGRVYKVERYFTVNQLTEAEKLEAASLSMSGEALACFWWEGQRPMRSWVEVNTSLLNLFRSTQARSRYEQF